MKDKFKSILLWFVPKSYRINKLEKKLRKLECLRRQLLWFVPEPRTDKSTDAYINAWYNKLAEWEYEIEEMNKQIRKMK